MQKYKLIEHINKNNTGIKNFILILTLFLRELNVTISHIILIIIYSNCKVNLKVLSIFHGTIY